MLSSRNCVVVTFSGGEEEIEKPEEKRGGRERSSALSLSPSSQYFH